MKRVISFFGILALFSLFPLSTQAAPVGKFTHVRGKVDITSPGEAARTARKGYEVNVGDIVRTKAKAKAEITFIDGNVLRLAQKSRVKITEYMVTKDQRRASIRLYRGKLRSMVKSVLAGWFGRNKRNRYEIRTPTAIVGVRGTDFFSYYLQGVSGAMCKEGHVYGYPVNNPEAVKIISAGQALLIKSAEETPVKTDFTDEQQKKEGDNTDPGSEEGTKTEGETIAEPTIAELILETGEVEETKIGVAITEGGETGPEIPYEQPIIEEGFTTFSIDVPFGFLTGDERATLTGSIDNITNASNEFGLSGNAANWPTNTWGSQFDGSMTDQDTGGQSAMNGTLQGVSGSWNSVVSSLYLGGGEAGYVYGTLSGTDNPDTYAFSGSGSALRLIKGSTHKSPTLDPYTRELSMTGHLISWPYPLPILQNVTAGGSMTKGAASNTYSTGIDLGRLNPDTGEYEDSGGRKLGIFGVQTSGWTYSNPLSETAWQGLYGDYSIGSYYMLGDVYGTDDLAGHVGMAGFLVYMDSDYFGGIDVSYRGHASSYESAGAGTYTLDPLAYSGCMSGDLYINNSGYMNAAGNITALVGGLVSPWDNASSSLLLLGDYTGAGPGVSYLWNSEIDAFDRSDPGNALYGYAGGPWEDPGTGNGTLYGPAVAIYSDSSGNVGLLTASLSGDSYPGLGQWIASGTWTRTFKETVDPADLEEYWDELSATVVGDFGGSGEIYGEGYGETQFVSLLSEDRDLPWGVYNLKLGSPNTFSGKPAGDANWSAKAGGGLGYCEEGFWLADVTGTWSDAGKITGNLSGTYLTLTQTGNIGGDFHGINNGISGDWIGQSIGTYEGQPLKFNGVLEGDPLYTLTLVEEAGPTYPLTQSGDQQGLMGSLDDLWAAGAGSPASTMFIGEFNWSPTFGPDAPRVFCLDIMSYNPYDGTPTILNQDDNSQNGAYYGYLGGLTSGNDSVMDGGTLAVYLDKDGNAGILKGTLNNTKLYADAGFWESQGSIFPIELISDTGYLPVNLQEGGVLLLEEFGPLPMNSHGQFYDASTSSYVGDIARLSVVSNKAKIYSDGQLWRMGVRSLLFGGTYTGPTYDHWVIPFNTDDGASRQRGYRFSSTRHDETNGTWSNGAISGKGVGAWANWNAGLTGLSGGDIKGTFDSDDLTWQASELWAFIDTNTFLSLADPSTPGGQAKLAQLYIPSISVGVADLSGSKDFGGGNTISIIMDDVTFYTYSTGTFPRIWATNQVSGAYTGMPQLNQAFYLSQGSGTNANVSAQFELTKWDTGLSKWGAYVHSGTGTVNTHAIRFDGSAAGQIDSLDSSFNGTASGVACPPLPTSPSILLSGDIYKLVKGTTYESYFRAYDSPSTWNAYGDYDYEYFVSEGDSVLRYGEREEDVYGGSEVEEIFLPEGTQIRVDYNHIETITVGTWTVGSKSPGYFTTLPDPPPGATFWERHDYEEWVSDAIAVNGAVGGSMDITGDLWSATESSPAGLTLMGTYGYTDRNPDQPFVFDTDIQASEITNGAYKGCLGGVMDEMDGVAGGVYAVYVNPSQGAGVIDPAFAGATSPGGLWEATGAIYPIEKVSKIGFGPDLLDSNLQYGWIGGFLAGDFGSENSWVWSDWLWGTTYSITGHDDWGAFGFNGVFDNALENPAAGTWSARASGYAQFGEHVTSTGTAPDTGIWLTDSMNGTLTNDILYAPFTGKGLTFSRYLDISGKIIGVVAPNVTHETYIGWMVQGGGYWENGQALQFNGILEADQFSMVESYHGTWYESGNSYDYDYLTGTNSGWSWKTVDGTETHISYNPDGTKEAWAEDSSGNLTYWEDVWDNTEPGSGRVAMLSDAPSGADPVETGPNYQFRDSGDLEDFMGGLSDLWAAGAATPASTVFIGEYDWWSEFGPHTPRVFYGDIHSYNPYDDTYTIWDQTDISQNGAYWGVMAGRTYGNGGVVEAGILGVYLDKGGNAGMVKGTLNGDLYADTEMWDGTGSMFPMELLHDTGLSLANFDPAIADYLHVPPEEWAAIDSHGQFVNESPLEFYGDIHARDWRSSRISLYQPGGSWLFNTRASLYGGTYSGTPSPYWYVPWYSDDGTVIKRAVTLSSPDSPDTMGSWSDGKIDAKGFGSWVHWDIGLTGVSGSELKGTFDPNKSTWQAAALWAGMDTGTFVSLTLTEAGRDKLRQLNIPYMNVGMADLSSGVVPVSLPGGTMKVDMPNTTFYAFYDGSRPRIWATNGVTGTYTGTPASIEAVGDASAWSVPLTGSNYTKASGLIADFKVQRWEGTGGNWGARIQNGVGTVNDHNIVFRGEAAGGIDTGGSGTFSGTASGTASPATP